MLRYKVKLNEPKSYNEIICNELYLSPDLSFISGVTNANYGLIDGQHLSIEFNNDGRFHDVIVETKDVLRQGYVIFEQEFKVEEYEDKKMYRYVDGKYYFTEETEYVKKNVTYWVENKQVTIGDNVYDADIQLDKDGNTVFPPYITIKGGKQLPINDCNKSKWKQVTKFIIRKNKDYNLVIDYVSCAKKYPYFVYSYDKEYSENDKTKIYSLNSEKCYLTFDKNNKNFICEVDNKTFIQEHSIVKEKEKGEETYELQYEWRNVSSSNYLHIFLHMPQYNLTSSQKILAETKSTVTTKCELIYKGDVKPEDGCYITYCGKKYYESKKDDTVDYLIIEDKEFKIIYTKKDKTYGYINLNNETISIQINGEKGVKLNQHKLGSSKEYKIKKYRYIEIDGVKYLVKKYYKNNENNDEIYYVNIKRKESFILTIVESIDNSMLRCVPDIGEDGDLSGVSSLIASNFENMIFKLLNPLFEEYNVSKQNYFLSLERSEEEIFDSIKIFNPSFYVKLPMLMGNDMSTNVNQSDILENIFFKSEIEKSINTSVDMEREIYYPCFNNEEDETKKPILSLINEIQFDLHFRSRNLEDWKINEDIYKDLSAADKNKLKVKYSWNIFDNYEDYSDGNTAYVNKDGETLKPSILNTIDLKYYQPADLLYFLNFNTDDVFYQKSKISKSFLRLLFFDSMDVINQTLLYSCTVFLNENKLYKTYIDNVIKKDNLYVSVSEEININEPLTSSTISEYNDTCDENDYVTFEKEKRLAATFSVKNRYECEESAEGFYLHIFKDYCEKLHEKTIYMKVEFNHAGEGRTINFTMPFKYEDNDIKLMDLSPNSDDLTTFKEGYSLNELYEHLFIPIKIVYDDVNKRYSYYLPRGLAPENYDNDKIMKFNLYELKIKDES